MGKILKFILLFVVLSLSIWYFFIKDYNYKITFITPHASGIVFDYIPRWNDGKTLDNKVLHTLQKTPFTKLQQEFASGDTLYKIDWVLKSINDSSTQVIAKFKDEHNSLKQNFQVLFGKNDFARRCVSSVKRLGKKLIENAKYYGLSKVSKEIIPSQNCAYITLSSKLEDKARTMINNIHNVMYYIRDNNLELTGDPFLEVINWDIDNNNIQFDFCFPIKEQDNYPETNVVKFKKTTEKEALKMVFNGNYGVTDRAWYSIIHFAQVNDIELEYLPVEFFLNDPHEGGNDLDWQAEIFMPVKKM